MPVQYQSDPMANAQQQVITPGGLVTSAHPVYGGGANTGGASQSSGNVYATRPASAVGVGNGNAQGHQSNFGPVDTGVGAFQQFADNSYDAAMRQMAPQMEAQQRQIQQQLVGKGLQPGTAAYNAEMDRMTRGQNDMLQSAAFGAQNAGLQAQNQYFNQESQNNAFGLAQNNQNYTHGYNYDALDNQRAIAGIGANAQMMAAGAAAGASRYGADTRLELGNNQLTEQGRQFNASDAFRNQQLDSSNMWNAANAFNSFNNTNTNNFNSQQAANQNWFGNAQSQIGMAPGTQFTPVGGTAQNMMANGQAQADASTGMWGNIASGVGAYFSCDATMKENIKPDGKDNGIDMFKFNYKGSKALYRGPIAQLIAKSHPKAVFERMGKLVVDFNQLPVDMELLHV